MRSVAALTAEALARWADPEREALVEKWRRAERQAQELSERGTLFEEFMNNSPTIAFMKDEDGRLLYANPIFERAFHMRLSEVLGKTDGELWPRETAEVLRANDLAILQSGVPRQVEETVWQADGAHHWLSYKFPLRRMNGQRALAGMAIEITERKRLHRELEQALALRDEFISVAAHELRTPLTPLKIDLNALSANAHTTPPERLERVLERCQRQVSRLNTLIEDLLSVAGLSAGALELRPAPLDLLALAHEVAQRARATRKPSPEITVRGEPTVGNWDPLRIEQCLVNLLGNALKYGQNKPVELVVGSTDAVATISVIDRGIGISVEDQARIFRRFERAGASRRYGGLGLGLYITRSIAEAHGGTVRVTSRPGDGATFTILLPLPPH